MNEPEYLERRIEIEGVFEIPMTVSLPEFKEELHAVFKDKGWEFKGFTADITSGRQR